MGATGLIRVVSERARGNCGSDCRENRDKNEFEWGA